MKKEFFAIVLLGAMIIVSILNIGGIVRLADELTAEINDSADAVKEENWDSAEQYVKNAIAIWNDNDSYTHIVLRHSEIDMLSDSLFEFMSDVLEKNGEAAEASSQKVLYHLESLSQMERVRIGSIF